MTNQKTCAERVQEQWEGRLADLEAFCDMRWADLGDLNSEDYDSETWDRFCEVGSWHDYGLCFDWVEPGTFEDQPAGYYRWQFSWGGPSDELRFHPDGTIEYRFHDWFDGAGIDVTDCPHACEAAMTFQEIAMMPQYDGVIDWRRV